MKTKYIKSFLLFLLLGCCISVSAQNIQGVVTDSLTNEPIPYLSVFYEGKGVGSITDNDGNYKVETRKRLGINSPFRSGGICNKSRWNIITRRSPRT